MTEVRARLQGNIKHLKQMEKTTDDLETDTSQFSAFAALLNETVHEGKKEWKDFDLNEIEKEIKEGQQIDHVILNKWKQRINQAEAYLNVKFLSNYKRESKPKYQKRTDQIKRLRSAIQGLENQNSEIVATHGHSVDSSLRRPVRGSGWLKRKLLSDYGATAQLQDVALDKPKQKAPGFFEKWCCCPCICGDEKEKADNQPSAPAIQKMG